MHLPGSNIVGGAEKSHRTNLRWRKCLQVKDSSIHLASEKMEEEVFFFTQYRCLGGGKGEEQVLKVSKLAKGLTKKMARRYASN